MVEVPTTAFRAKAKPVVQSWPGVPVWMARFHVAALTAFRAAATIDAVEPTHAVAAKNALAFVRCVTELIRVAAKIRVVQPGVKAPIL